MPFRVQCNNLALVGAHLRVRPKRFLVSLYGEFESLVIKRVGIARHDLVMHICTQPGDVSGLRGSYSR